MLKVLIFIITCSSLHAIEWEWPKVNLAAILKSKSVFRGAMTWNKPGLTVGPELIFYDHYVIRGPHIFYKHFLDRNSSYEWDIGWRLVGDSRPMIRFTSDGRDFRNSRNTSHELFTKFTYKFGWMKKFSVGGEFSADIDENKGFFYLLKFGLPVYKFTSLETKFGFGTEAMNDYIYGPHAVSGPGFYAISLTYVYPHVPWKGIVINSLEYSKVVQSENRNAELLGGRYQDLCYKLMVIYSF